MADEASDTVKPWTIRGIPPEERNAAIEAADRSDLNLGEWIGRAIRTQIQQERRMPVPVEQTSSDSPTESPPLVATEIPERQTQRLDVMQIVSAFHMLASAGVPIPKGHVAKITRALVAQLPGNVRQ